MNTLRTVAILCCLSLLATGCAYRYAVENQQQNSLYGVAAEPDTALSRFAPLFLVYGSEKGYNRIGRPVAENSAQHDETIAVDPDTPAVYTMIRTFTTEKGTYTNYIYRVHFPEIPFSLIPFHLTAGNNIGLMVVITVDSRGLPVLVTTTHTCGCYTSIIPTTYLPRESYPANWSDNPADVYGETLPARLDYAGKPDSKIMVHLRPAVHRIMHLETVPASFETPARADFRAMTSYPIGELERISLNGRSTSLYYDSGPLKGHVKGSVKVWETLFLSLISLDLFVGTDKAYADTAVTQNSFYTSLKPWNRTASDMWYFDTFLDFWGWHL